ncbi:MAG: hypothetical protein NZM25_05105 [Leptospiraceae bacterium]|nr:hypothetical protein [Leptospiraceae bacterium]MDW8305614.1 hypothetical protein [Leptospiraceae bacterium]
MCYLRYRIFFFVTISCDLAAGYLHETRTVYLLEPGLVSFDIYQKFYKDGPNRIFLREQSIFLALSKKLEMQIHIPYINSLQQHYHFHRFGDIRLSLNWATNWFKPFLLTNFFVEYNFGTGPNYRDENTNKMESYGYPELRLGPLVMKKVGVFYYHANFFYVARGARDDGGRERTIFNGFDLNILESRAWRKWLGFNPREESNFFYYRNFFNDILEYSLAISSDLYYPIVLFQEITFSHDFRSYQGFNPRAPGSGIARFQYSMGTKLLLSEDHFALKLVFFLPIGELGDIYEVGMGFGVRVEF